MPTTIKTLPRGEFSPGLTPPATSLPPKKAAAAVEAAVREACRLWASANLVGRPTAELQRGLATVARHPDALRPFVSTARTAYTRLTQELAARHD